ncbi:Hypothetical protein MELLADRAFT_72526 [Melampsora larici-populina 98AG31]|uniref:Uncharacterized protein n=1 Tax=Melampsora larici-populina (strain 98AG31 / pathotype 3-4-7) TaxID=747676 RepID=F4RV26_MELLP|nr:Hypothetical protein MELLADRAFT_72526 [Melampsora larici-populina 98AG31]EGG03803.1 Hypothetical protein MELLADRAFT_72526 [Melampsora larici-populina 98AG31]
MRSSRRNLGLRPEYSPEPTPPNSDILVPDSEGNWNIENTLEEEERIRKEDEQENRLNEERSEEEIDSSIEEIKLIKNKSKIKDINWSSEDDSSSSSSKEKTIKLDQSTLIDKAYKALDLGDSKLAKKLLLKMKVEELINTTKSTSDKANPMSKYKSGKTANNTLRRFTDYWDNHLKLMDIHFPLTIFNSEWIEFDSLIAGKSMSKKKDKPTGQPAKNEWWLSFADWTRARILMVKYLKEQYGHEAFAKDLEKHFEYVQQLSDRHGWIVAFRYDIAVRNDVTCNRIDGAPGDPSERRQEFLDDAIARTAFLQAVARRIWGWPDTALRVLRILP